MKEMPINPNNPIYPSYFNLNHSLDSCGLKYALIIYATKRAISKIKGIRIISMLNFNYIEFIYPP